MPSCKKDTWQDFKARNQNPGQSNENPAFTIYEPFMGHMQNVRDAVFYQPCEDTHRFLFHTNMMNEVSGFTELRDVLDKDTDIDNQYDAPRIDNDNTAVDNSAKFMIPTYYEYRVDVEDQYGWHVDWAIECVPENSEYRNMTNQQLADLAYSRILDKAHSEEEAQIIHDAILNGQGQWTQEDPFYVTFNSNGWTQNLRNSDFGTFKCSALDYSEEESDVFSGGLPEKEIQKSAVEPQTFRATAYGRVKHKGENGLREVMYVSTGRDSATFTIDAMHNETIVMPFQNWYTVTITRTNNSVTSQFENNGSVSTMWQMPHQNIQETGYREGLQDNGLFAQDGLYGFEDWDGFVTGTSFNYYTDESGYVEFVGQGYRQDWLQNDKLEFKFSFGGTNRPREDDPTTGIEEIHYKSSVVNKGRNYQR